MVFYGLSITLLIYTAPVNSGKQIRYADDAGGAGKLSQLRHWWDFLCQMGPSFGYYPNAEKTISVVKPEQLNEAKFVSEETGVVITAGGTKCLGTPLGSKKYENQLLTNRADIIGKQLEKLQELRRCIRKQLMLVSVLDSGTSGTFLLVPWTFSVIMRTA